MASSVVVVFVMSASAGGEVRLRQEWSDFGRPAGFEEASAQELRGLADRRNRTRGERTRARRLELTRERPAAGKVVPQKRRRTGPDEDARAPATWPASRPSWVSAAVLFVPFDGMLDGCDMPMRDAFDGRLDEKSWDMNHFDSELRDCA